MKVRILDLLAAVRASYWFVPGVCGLLAVGVAIVMVQIDYAYEEMIAPVPWMQGIEASMAKSLVTTLAGSLITVAGVLFSITIVVMTLASNQYGPRMLRNFLADRGHQATFGVFVGTFVYCLLILTSFTPRGDSIFVPRLSVIVAMVAAIGAFGMLIFFIHHVASSIQAERILATVSGELHHALDKTYPERVGQDPPGPGEHQDPPGGDRAGPPHVFRADRDGYLHAVDAHSLLGLAKKDDLVIRMLVRPGDYIVRGLPLAEIEPADRVGESCSSRLEEAFVFGRSRSPVQDIQYAIRQLVEVALRALSPSLNDPFTAVACIDQLLGGLCSYLRRDRVSPDRHDDQGTLRLITLPVSFPEVVEEAFSQIRRCAQGDPYVSGRLLDALVVLARRVKQQEDRQALARQADAVMAGVSRNVSDGPDLETIQRRYDTFAQALEQSQQ